MFEILSRAAELKAELDTFRPLSAEMEARIMQKFRLDWNYNSNHLEGNQLSYGETRALLLFGVTAQGKPLKDHIEMTGHNEAIELIIDVIKDERPLNEAFIRELHTLLLKKDHYIQAQTANGIATRRLVQVGRYKTQPNHVLTVTGETFYFATPEETPAKMQELLAWYREKKDAPDTNPITLAAEFHYRFILIHPFDDGNGRMARLLMNFILMQFGYPPVIVKTDDKENYLNVLRLADAGNLEAFIEYIAVNLTYSLELMIKGAKGESIEDPTDLDKKLALLDQRLKSIGKRFSVKKTSKIVFTILEKSVFPLMDSFYPSAQKFNNFYLEPSFDVIVNLQTRNYSSTYEGARAEFSRFNLEYSNYLILQSVYKRFSTDEVEKFDYFSSVRFEFEIDRYKITVSDTADKYIETVKDYATYLTEDEISSIVTILGNRHYEFIEQKLNEKPTEPKAAGFKFPSESGSNSG
ncbi:MAG TPA: Fic family protein [Pyrinomonadaceae bacterium]|jgi:Fic family protein